MSYQTVDDTTDEHEQPDYGTVPRRVVVEMDELGKDSSYDNHFPVSGHWVDLPFSILFLLHIIGFGKFAHCSIFSVLYLTFNLSNVHFFLLLLQDVFAQFCL
jgi:hypothetical protein